MAVTLSVEPYSGIPSTASNQSQPLDWMKAADDEGVLMEQHCRPALQLLLLIHIALLALSLLLEISMAWLALQGTMWNVAPRRLMEHVLYSRLSKYIHHKLVSRRSLLYPVFFHPSASSTIFFLSRLSSRFSGWTRMVLFLHRLAPSPLRHMFCCRSKQRSFIG